MYLASLGREILRKERVEAGPVFLAGALREANSGYMGNCARKAIELLMKLEMCTRKTKTFQQARVAQRFTLHQSGSVAKIVLVLS